MGWLAWAIGGVACLVMSMAIAGVLYAAGRADDEIERIAAERARARKDTL